MVYPTLARRAADLPRYQSPYAPKYYYQSQVAGITTQTFLKTGVKAGFFGGVALFAVLFFGSGIPRIQRDILQKIPVIGSRFEKEIHPQDNPF
ncbi:hypothetical protein VTJ83DRAFT_4666 [Remersonia thermophila]|uniref:Cytochrome b-c1 complex subunit 10 n=1 Tax=Remersonia thermophila TaxID=72144 RepID=A0ABR4DCM6_9PEZI